MQVPRRQKPANRPGGSHTGAMTGPRVRPKADLFPLDDLVELARTGRIRVPSFQRGLRWARRDVVALFDSILSGYPIGSLLLWDRQADAETVTLGPLRIEAPAGPAFLVVDGQQRITALAAALTEAGHGDARFAVGYELASAEFTGRPARVPETWVPAHVLYDLSALLVWFRDRPELADRFENAAAVSKTLRDLRIPAYVVSQDDEAVLRTIFDRMNNAGKRLTRGEVFGALHRSADDPAAGSPRSVADQIEARTGFGALAEGVVMKMVLARRGPDVMREIHNEFSSVAKGRDAFAAQESPAAAYAATSDAAVAAIEFLQRSAGVPHRAFLPYEHLLVTLTRFFAHHPHPSVRHRRLLTRFFWRAAVAGPSLNGGDLTGLGRLLNRTVEVDDELASVIGLVSVAGSRSGYPSVDPFRTNSAATKALLCALWDLGPSGLNDGSPVQETDLLLVLGEQQTAAQIVVPLLGRVRVGTRELEAGNRLLLVPAADRDSDPLEVLAVAAPDVLAAHLLEPADVAALQGPDPQIVITRRAERMAESHRRFLDRVCEWDQEDAPELGMLVAAVGPIDAPA